jgi:hypothetical protein
VGRESRSDIPPAAAQAAAAQIFIHCFPLVLTDAVRRAHPLAFHQLHLVGENAESLAPGLGEYDPRVVVASAWVDLADEPVVLRLPPTHARYFTLTLVDTAGEPFATLGSRTGDDGGLDLALVGPTWRGELPSGLTARRAPSEAIWVVSRIHAHSAVDRAEAVAVAKRQCLALLRRELDWPRATLPDLDMPATSCIRQVADMPPTIFFHRLDSILDRAPLPYQQTVRPAVAALRAQLEGPPESSTWGPELEQALSKGLAEGLAAIRAAAEASAGSDGLSWRALGSRVDRSASNALNRAARAYAGLGAPTRDDLLSLEGEFDESGRQLHGADSYRIHFPREALPPVQAFWWLSPRPTPGYDRRQSIGDRNDLVLNADGSLDLIIQTTPPPTAQISNWLPAPEGDFSLVMQLYWPRPEALNGSWKMPPIERLGSGATRRGRATAKPLATPRAPGPTELGPLALAWRMTP